MFSKFSAKVNFSDPFAQKLFLQMCCVFQCGLSDLLGITNKLIEYAKIGRHIFLTNTQIPIQKRDRPRNKTYNPMLDHCDDSILQNVNK